MVKNKHHKKGKSRVMPDMNLDGDSSNDAESICSDGSNPTDDNRTTQDEQQPAASTEKYEEKILQSIENAMEKSSKTRIDALATISEILQHRYIPDFIEDRKMTLLDIIEKSLRRGKNDEQEMAAQLAILLNIQIGNCDDCFNTILDLLLTFVHNPSSPLSLKRKSCTILSMFYFLNSGDMNDIIETMIKLEKIFAGSYMKADHLPVNETETKIHVDALSAWGLLATLIPPRDFCSYINNNIIITSMKQFIGLLNSPYLDVRMMSGEVVAIILEIGRMSDEQFLNTYLDDLIDATSNLSKDSKKYLAKKKGQTQRALFRDILQYIEEDVSPETQIRFGKEFLLLDCWSDTIQYEKLCDVIGPGITTHLRENDFIRDIFQLGPKVKKPNDVYNKVQSKLKRNWMNAAAFKDRTKWMRDKRDKRLIVF